MSSASSRLRRIFALRYFLAIALLVIGATTSFVLSFSLASLDTDRSHAFNLVNGQRTFSQRIAFLVESLEATSAADEDAVRDELQVTVDRMRAAHETLLGNRTDSRPIARFIEPLDAFYSREGADFDSAVRRFLENADIVVATPPGTEEWAAIAPIRHEVVRAATDTMLQTHGLMELVLAAEANRLNQLERVFHIGAWLFMIALLGVVTFVIFRPMSRKIVGAFEEMERAEEKARAAQTEAQEANEARGHFFQAASHELKTPLNAILGIADTLKHETIPGCEDELRHLVGAANQLLLVLNNILDTHRAVDGGITLDQSPFRLIDALEQPIERAKTLADEKSLRFNVSLDIPPNLEALGDQRRLEQLFLNLLDNAVKFTKAGHVDFEAAASGEGNRRTLDINVRDSGCGIARDRLDSVFERFSVEGSLSARRGGGLGVGLALVKEIVTSMGGEIDLQSTPGKGTQVRLSLPLSVSEEPLPEVEPRPAAAEGRARDPEAVASDIAAPAPEAPAPKPTPRETPAAAAEPQFDVLIVDDNMANRMVAEALVRAVGGQTVAAENGRQAVDAAGETDFDLILMDISMPVMDGIEATQLIRAGGRANAKTPIVAVTAHMGPEDRGDLEQKGFSDVLSKPVRREMMARCVKRWVGAVGTMAEVA